MADNLPDSLPAAGLSGMLASASALEAARGELLLEDGARGVLRNVRLMAQKSMRNAGWAKLFCELMGWTGQRERIIAILVAQLGVPLERAQWAVKQVESVPEDVHEIARELRTWLTWYDSENGPGKDAPS